MKPTHAASRFALGCVLIGGHFTVLGQTVPQRSSDLCAALEQIAHETARTVTTIKPGACRINIDTGYDFWVNYDAVNLYLTLMMDADALNGDVSAFWLRLSAFDNLAHVALGSTQQKVFDELNKLTQKMATAYVRHKSTEMMHSKVEKVVLGAQAPANSPFVVVMASASAKDIDSMRKKAAMRNEAARREAPKAAGEVAGWRKVLGASLQAFSAGAQGYTRAYQQSIQSQRQQSQRPIQNCYTSFLGDTLLTSCY